MFSASVLQFKLRENSLRVQFQAFFSNVLAISFDIFIEQEEDEERHNIRGRNMRLS
jgi:hypothetical protein